MKYACRRGPFSAFGEGLQSCLLSGILSVESGIEMMSGAILGVTVEVSGARHCWVWLPVLKAGPSVFQAVSMLIVADVVGGSVV